MPSRSAFVLACSIVVSCAVAAPDARALEPGSWRWPVVGPVTRAFDPPESPFGSGHRGIDVAASPGSTLVAPAPGTVTFAGPIGGELFVSIAHGGSWQSTASWLSALAVRRGDVVFAGQRIGATGTGHPGAEVAHVHLGVKYAGSYVDPLDVYGPLPLASMVRLAALPAAAPASFVASSAWRVSPSPARRSASVLGAPVGWAADPGGERPS